VGRKNPFTALLLASKVRRLIKERGIKLVHARSRVPAWIGRLATRGTGVPFVTTAQGLYAPHFFSRVMGMGDRVIVISKLIRDHMSSTFGTPEEKMRTVFRGFSAEDFPPVPDERVAALREEFGLKPDDRLVGAVGRITHTKGFDTLLQAASHLTGRYPRLKVMIVGGVDPRREEFAEKLNAMAAAPELKGRVIFAGHRSDVGDFYPLFDICVMASAFPEPFGRVALEALAAGAPVAMSTGSGASEPFGDEISPWLAIPGDAGSLARCLDGMLSDPGEARNLAARFKTIVRERLTAERMCSETFAVYNELVT